VVNYWKSFFFLSKIGLSDMSACRSWKALQNRIQRTLVPLKCYGNEIYYIPFDASRLVLQHGISDLSILDRSSYPTGFFILRAYLIEKQSKQTALQLQDLKNVIQSKKIEERQTPLDKAHEENLAVGDNKYSSIQKASLGPASKRMAMLQDL